MIMPKHTKENEEYEEGFLVQTSFVFVTFVVVRCFVVPSLRPLRYGNCAGGTRFFVACSYAYASAISFGSLQAMAVKLTPSGPGRASNPDGNAGVGAFATSALG